MSDIDILDRKLDTIYAQVNVLIDMINKYSGDVEQLSIIWKKHIQERYNLSNKEAGFNIIELVYVLSKQGIPVRKQADILGISVGTVHNYRKKLKGAGRL